MRFDKTLVVIAPVVAALAAAATLTACSSSLSGTPSRASDSAARAAVAHRVLTVSDLPTGWAVDNSKDSGGDSGSFCGSNSSVDGSSASKDAQFSYNGSLPELEESIGFFAGSKAETGFKSAEQRLDRCKQISFTSGGQKISGSIGRLSFPSFGDHSAAYSATLSAQGLDVSLGICLVNVGHYDALVGLIDLGSFDSSQLQDLVKRAVAKLS